MNEIHERAIKESDFATVLCDDLELEGTLHCERPILLNCRFEGALVGEEQVVIYRDAVFKGTIHARSIRVSGQVEGDLYATDLVELESSGGVYGNITAPSIVMENGSIFEGQSHVLRKDKKSRQRKITSKTIEQSPKPQVDGIGSSLTSVAVDKPDTKQVDRVDKNPVEGEGFSSSKVGKQKLVTVKRS